jgi:hypothetical protein
MNFSLTIPQLFYDLIARVLPGFLFLVALRLCLAGTGIDPRSVISFESKTSVGNMLEGLSFLMLCYFCGWLLRSLRWPNRQPDESTEFRTMYQRVRLQHPESGFRVVKLRAEARLLEASRAGMFIVGGIALAAWVFSGTELVAGDSIHRSRWVLRVVIPVLVGIVFLMRESGVWRTYRGNVEKLHSLIIDEGFPRRNAASPEVAAQPGDAADATSPRP